jgi:hypothetical protein
LHSVSNQFHRTEEKDIARVINFESPWVEGSRTDIELLDLPRFGWLGVSGSDGCACIAVSQDLFATDLVQQPKTVCVPLLQMQGSVVWSAVDCLFEQEPFPFKIWHSGITTNHTNLRIQSSPNLGQSSCRILKLQNMLASIKDGEDGRHRTLTVLTNNGKGVQAA